MKQIRPIEVLDKKHERKYFQCEEPMLDNYLKSQAGQDLRKKLSVCFVLLHENTDVVIGYYTLSNYSIPLELIPIEYSRNFPKSYKSIPTTLLGRLAIDKTHKGNRFGEFLLLDAMKKSYAISQTVGSFAVVTDPLNKKAEDFYNKYGFKKLPDSGKMFMAMKTIKELFT